jgi:sugar phosphate permease
LTIIPGALAVASLFLVKEPAVAGRERARAQAEPPGADAPGWRELPSRYFVLLGVLLVFALGNSADAFLLLRLTDVGVEAAFIPLLWAALHVVKSLASVWGGATSDRLGRRAMIGAGWLIYAIVYVGFAVSTSVAALVGLLLFYGVYFGLSEGTEKALIADLAPASLRGTAFGLYYASAGFGSLGASVAFGLVWKAVSPAAAFGMGAALALLATLLLATLVRERAGAQR